MSYDEDGPTKCIAFLENVVDIFGYQVECCRENEGWSAYCVKHIKYDDIPENTSSTSSTLSGNPNADEVVVVSHSLLPTDVTTCT